jgi:8-oxo-dGTP diphosphatase
VADDPLDRSRTYVAAGVVFFDDENRVLLVQPTYKDYGDIPGGYVEAGEAPAQAAAYEVREELGIEIAVGPLLVADWAPHPDEGDKLLLIFDGGTLTTEQLTAINLQADELVSYVFHDPAETATLLIPRLGGRVRAAFDAHHTGPTAYLERHPAHSRAMLEWLSHDFGHAVVQQRTRAEADIAGDRTMPSGCSSSPRWVSRSPVERRYQAIRADAHTPGRFSMSLGALASPDTGPIGRMVEGSPTTSSTHSPRAAAHSHQPRTSHLLSARVQLLVEITAPTMLRTREPALYDAPLLRFSL